MQAGRHRSGVHPVETVVMRPSILRLTIMAKEMDGRCPFQDPTSTLANEIGSILVWHKQATSLPEDSIPEGEAFKSGLILVLAESWWWSRSNCSKPWKGTKLCMRHCDRRFFSPFTMVSYHAGPTHRRFMASARLSVGSQCPRRWSCRLAWSHFKSFKSRFSSRRIPAFTRSPLISSGSFHQWRVFSFKCGTWKVHTLWSNFSGYGENWGNL